MHNTIPKVVEWAKARNLITGSSPAQQMLKGQEECGELFEALLAGDRDGLIDALGDEMVVLTILCCQLGQDPHALIGDPLVVCAPEDTIMNVAATVIVAKGVLAAAIAKNRSTAGPIRLLTSRLATLAFYRDITLAEAYAAAYEEIKDRRGEMRDGVFVKEEDL